MKLRLLILASLIALSLANDATYAQLFYELLGDEANSPPGYEVEYYCVRKYVKDAELTDYTFKVNPKQINVLSVNCDAQIRLAMNDAATVIAGDKGLKGEQKECVRKTFLEGTYFNAMAVVVAIGQLKTLTVAEIDVEKAKFVEAMRRMTEDCNKCFEKKEKKQPAEEEKKES